MILLMLMLCLHVAYSESVTLWLIFVLKDSRSVPETVVMRLEALEQRYNLLVKVVCTQYVATAVDLSSSLRLESASHNSA